MKKAYIVVRTCNDCPYKIVEGEETMTYIGGAFATNNVKHIYCKITGHKVYSNTIPNDCPLDDWLKEIKL